MNTPQLNIKDIRAARLRADHGTILVLLPYEKKSARYMPILINAWQNREFQIVALTHHSLN